MENRERFEKLWNRFYALVRGKLLTQSKKQDITNNLAKLILADSQSFWDSGEGGMWLRGICERDPHKGSMISEMLLYNMTFSPIEEKKDNSMLITGAVCVGSALVGLGITGALGAGLLVKAIVTTALPVAAVPIVRVYNKNADAKTKTDTIDKYMIQLDKYKMSVIGALGNVIDDG